MSIYRPLSTVLVAIPLLGTISSHANAQDIAPGVIDFGTTTVTVRGFAENQLETPFVVNSISAITLNQQNISTAEQAIRSQPNIDVHNGGHVEYSSLWMRGTGSLSITSLDDDSVDVRVDGISNGKTGLARNLIDIEKIEVAKGPQGTLLGTKAEAGSFIIKTNDPVDEFEGHVGVGVGNKNHKSLEAVINVPVTNNLAVRVAGVTSETDNYILKSEDNTPLNTKKKQGIQAKLRWQDGNNDLVLGGYHDTQTNDVPIVQTNFDSNKISTFGLAHDSDNVSKGITLATKNDLGFARIETNGGYHVYSGEILRPLLPPEILPMQYAQLQIPAQLHPTLNAVFAKADNNRQLLKEESKQLSQEIRLVSQPDSKTKWVAGVYLENKERNWHNDSKLALTNLPNSPVKAYLTTTSSNGDSKKTFDKNTQAIFGEITYPVGKSLNLVAGARYTHENLGHKTIWVGNSNNALATGVKSDRKTLDDDAITGRLGLSYALIPNWRVYGIYSRGNKFGGFADYESNVVYGNPLSYFKPTTIDAMELGTKFQSADKRLNLGIALYQNRMQDDHITVLGLPPKYDSSTANVDTQSTGAEISLDWKVTDHIQLKTDLAYTDTEVTDASNVPAPKPGQLQLTANGNQMPQVPKFSGSLGVRVSDDVQGLPLFKNAQWYVGADYRYVGKRFAQSYNVFELDGYGLLGLNMGIMGEHHELSLWGKNLTDEQYLNIGIQPGSVGTVGEDRSFGLKYGYHF